MPPKSSEYWNLLPYFITTADGQEVKIEPVTLVEEPEEPDEPVRWLADMPIEFTINAFVRNGRGLMDYLRGRTWTKACGRFVRSMKRNKEKNRRKKLKGD